jgi:hypothetical protein
LIFDKWNILKGSIISFTNFKNICINEIKIENFTISKISNNKNKNKNKISVRAAKVLWYVRDIMRKYLSQ